MPGIFEALGLSNTRSRQFDPHLDDVGVYYSALQQWVEFDVETCRPRLDEAMTVADIVRSYIDDYDLERDRVIHFSERYQLPA